MASRRRTTPLFEVLQASQPRRPDPGPPPGHGVPEGGAPPSEQRRPEPGRTPRSGGEFPVRLVAGVVHLPLPYAAGAAALVLAIILGAWTMGFQRGRSEERARQQALESALPRESRVVEPDSGQGRIAQPAAPRPGEARAVPTAGPARFLTSSGPTETDPRLDRHNYLQLGSQIRASEVRSAIDLMVSRGLGCFGVVDPRSLRRNDEPLYVLFASRGFPSGQTDSPEARRYRDQVLAAGVAWKQAGGVKDFKDALWVLHRQ